MWAGLLPEDKAALVRRRGAAGERVAMVGDGINDAQALTEAPVGIAMGAARADVAMETADIALMNDDLKKVAEAIALGHSVLPTVKQDILVFAVFLNALGVLLAGTGVVHPVGAALLHSIGSIAVVLNSARLIFRQRL